MSGVNGIRNAHVLNLAEPQSAGYTRTPSHPIDKILGIAPRYSDKNQNLRPVESRPVGTLKLDRPGALVDKTGKESLTAKLTRDPRMVAQQGAVGTRENPVGMKDLGDLFRTIDSTGARPSYMADAGWGGTSNPVHKAGTKLWVGELPHAVVSTGVYDNVVGGPLNELKAFDWGKVKLEDMPVGSAVIGLDKNQYRGTVSFNKDKEGPVVLNISHNVKFSAADDAPAYQANRQIYLERSVAELLDKRYRSVALLGQREKGPVLSERDLRKGNTPWPEGSTSAQVEKFAQELSVQLKAQRGVSGKAKD